jgi:hypothetical protein
LRPLGRPGDGRGRVNLPGVLIKRLTLRQLVTVIAFLGAVTLVSATVNAEEIDFDQINKFESLATGTLNVGAPPKTLVVASDTS